MTKKKMERKKIKRKIKKAKSLKVEKKRLEIQKNNLSDEKVIIKKIRKQPTEKKRFNINQYVVYPKHGVGKILSVEKTVISEIETNCYKVLIPRDKLTLTVPVNQQSNLRPTSSINQINKCVAILSQFLKIRLITIFVRINKLFPKDSSQ